MALRYPTHQAFGLYGQPQWSEEDVKPGFGEDDDDDDDRDTSEILDDKKGLDSSTSVGVTGASHGRRPSMIKVEDDFTAAPAQMWTDRPHVAMAQMRHYSHSGVPMSSLNTQAVVQMNEAQYGTPYVPPPAWPLSAQSETSTPTPMYGPVQDSFGQPLPYHGGPVSYPGYPQPDPASAVSMSPQSSQGGWCSAASSDTAESRAGLRNPRFRGSSPMTVLRSDGIRKKNAKFEIPKERNLANIDALILQSTDETEKKELKQQKRLLRNRQAALDSRQRKKTHTEKLEQEKKTFTAQKAELEETITQLESTLNHEREQWMQQRQQYDQFIHQLQYDRDEAIRTKTLETAELRRMNNVLKDCIRDLERQQSARGYMSSSDAFSTDFSNFGALDIEDNWDDEFSLINRDDLKMEDSDALQRQATPRPPPPPASSTQPPMTTSSKAVDTKSEGGFSWNTFYMCLLFGAFIASNTGTKDPSSTSAAAILPSSIPPLSEDYRAEAGNVLKAVLDSAPESASELMPSRPALGYANSNLPITVSGSELSRMNPHQSSTSASTNGASTLDALHTTLTTPTRHQQTAAAFTLSAASYNHIANGDGAFDDDDEELVEVKPTRLQQLFASMQAERDGIDRMSGLSSKARERSVLLDHVPEKVLRDFREMIARVE